ncbi:hypothetical protein [Amycolatopsis sp. CB00013]|uniref:hypothetical protein n=1 Tax=Amycolatopsis sp. CB00013 TaxID=1703945 RepID=UPI001160F93C|nr:hypothetical protein [Amycolatopsis sp. CB00013]
MSANVVGHRSLTQVEQDLVLHVERGDLLDLAGDESLDENAMRTWGDSRTIRAEVLRDILRGRLAPDPDPQGLRLRGARIAGRLNLDNLTSTVVTVLDGCILSEGITARDSHLVSLDVSRCLIEHLTEVPGDFTGMAVADLTLKSTTVTASNKRGAVRLYAARVSSQLNCNKATLSNSSGPALDATNLKVDQDVLMGEGFSATGTGDWGAVRLVGAQVGGQLICVGATLNNPSGPALSATNLQVDQDVVLSEGFSATGTGEGGAVRLYAARIGGQLHCSGATLGSSHGSALDAILLQVDQDVYMDEGFSATGTGDWGAVRLHVARIGGQLHFRGATLNNPAGPALDAEGLHVERGMFLSEGFSATGTGEKGTVRLFSARVGGELYCSEATLSNSSGPALNAANLKVGQSLSLRGGFAATGTGKGGTVRLYGARIGGQLNCNKATLSNSSGPALDATSLQVDQSAFLDGGFSATGAGEGGAVRLSGARIGGQLHCSRATLSSSSSSALDATRIQVEHDLFLAVEFSAKGAGEYVVLDLEDARVGGEIWLDITRITHSSSTQNRLEVDGLMYAGLPRLVSADSWLRLLREATPEYTAQPYQYLAAAHRALGHDQEARRVLIQQRRDQIQRRALTGRAERAWARLTGVVLGYGYQPWRALLGLLATFTLAAIVSVVLGSHGALARVHTPPDPAPVNCTVVERIGVGLDLGTPLVSTGARARCDTTRTATGQAFTLVGWGLRLLAWAFATLFVAGFTGAVRKT